MRIIRYIKRGERMNVYYDVEDDYYRTYPDGDIATIDQMKKLIENKNLSILKLQQENKHLDEVNCKLRRKIGQLEQEKEKITKSRDFHLRFNKSLINGVDECQKDKEIQQKEFMKWLEDEIKSSSALDIINKQIAMYIYSTTLKKYKEIIGVSDENNKQ